MSQRYVEATFVRDGVRVREDYGPFLSSAHVVAWLDRRDAKADFGPHAEFVIRRLGIPDVDAPVRRTRKSTNQPTSSAELNSARSN